MSALVVDSRRVVEPHGMVRVSHDMHELRVRWFCGEQFAFTKDGIRDAITHLEAMKDHGEDVWVRLRDEYGKSFHARVHEGMLYAKDIGRVVPQGVTWPLLRKAIKATLKDMGEAGLLAALRS